MAGSSIIMQTSDLIRSGREAELRRTDYVCVLILVDTTAPRTLVLPIRDALDPHLPTADVRVRAAGERDLMTSPVPDVCIAVMGSDTAGVAEDVCELAGAGVPVGIVAESALDVPNLSLGPVAAERVAILSATSEEVLVERLAEWLISATDKSIALAANFPFCRKAKVRHLVNELALENATATAKRGPGAELPSMTASQVRLALTIAAINGQPLSLGRVPEVLTAVSAGFGSRMMANKALGRLPVVGWFVKMGMGYLGTQATGRTLQHRFEKREQRQEGEPTRQKGSPSRAERLATALRRQVQGARAAARSDSSRHAGLLTAGADGANRTNNQGGLS